MLTHHGARIVFCTAYESAPHERFGKSVVGDPDIVIIGALIVSAFPA
jgi:hypothetical protein